MRRGRSWFWRATRIGCNSLGQGQSSIQRSCGLIWNFVYPRLLQNGHWIPVHNRVRSWNICSGTRADTRPFRLEPLPHPKLRRLFLQLLSFLTITTFLSAAYSKGPGRFPFVSNPLLLAVPILHYFSFLLPAGPPPAYQFNIDDVFIRGGRLLEPIVFGIFGYGVGGCRFVHKLLF